MPRNPSNKRKDTAGQTLGYGRVRLTVGSGDEGFGVEVFDGRTFAHIATVDTTDQAAWIVDILRRAIADAIECDRGLKTNRAHTRRCVEAFEELAFRPGLSMTGLVAELITIGETLAAECGQAGIASPAVNRWCRIVDGCLVRSAEVPGTVKESVTETIREKTTQHSNENANGRTDAAPGTSAL